MSTNERLNTGRNATATTKELTTTVTTLTTELGASIQQLEVTRKELVTERQNYFYLNRALENAVARLQRREQAKWRRVLSLLLTIVVLSAVTGAASFGVFLWLVLSGGYHPGVVRRVQGQEGKS